MKVVLMDVNAAKAKYPLAWRTIETSIVEIRAASNAYVTPFAAHVVVIDSVEMLEVIASTDLVAEETDEPMNMCFHAPITPTRPALSLVT